MSRRAEQLAIIFAHGLAALRAGRMHPVALQLRDEGADVLGGDRLPALLPFRVRVPLAGLDQLVHRDRAAARALHANYLLELGDPVPDFVDLGQLLGVLYDNRLRIRVLDHVLALLGRVGLVDRDDGGAHAEGGEVEVGPLRTGVGEDRDLVALLDAELDQAQGELPDDLPDFAVGLGDPFAGGVLVGDRRQICMALGREWHQVGARLAVGARVRGGPGSRDRRALHWRESIRRLAARPASGSGGRALAG